jgi:pyruvate,water dikinase
MMTFVDTFKTLAELAAGDLPRAGGKAFNCAKLKQAGLPVPDGIVVPSDATDEEIRDLHANAWLTEQPADAFFAVRSSGLGEDSAGHSFAGMHETQLNVARNEVAEAVLVCRRSAQSEQARAYREARSLGADDARIAVLVQRMVPAIGSGVAFTLNPITGADELVVNAAFGLGEELVSGRVDPDEYLVSKRDGAVLALRRGGAAAGSAMPPVLTEAQIRSLAALLTRIESLYGAPQDVEWCHDGEQFWIVQSRPVTTFVSSKDEVRSTNSELGTPNAEPRTPNPEVEWTRANLAEVLPDQLSPQALALYEVVLGASERKFFGRLVAPESELGPIIKAFHGRLYFNLSQLRYVSESIGAAFADTLRSLGHPEAIQPDDEIAKRPPLGRLLRALPSLLRVIAGDVRAEQIFRDHEASTERALAKLSVDPAPMSDAAIWALCQWWLSSMPDTLNTVFTMSGVQGREASIRAACRKVGFPYDRLVYPLLAAGERSVSTQQAMDVIALAEIARHESPTAGYLLANDGTFTDFRTALAGTSFLAAFDLFLARYGHRGRYESDWALPRLHENPAPVLFAVRGQLQGPPQDTKAIAARQVADAAAAWAAFEAQLTPWQRRTMLPRVRAAVTRLKKQYVWREKVRSDLARVVSKVRTLHLAMADRFVERGWIDRRDDYFLLHLAEIGAAIEDPSRSEPLRGLAATRAAMLAAERDLRMPLFMRESELASLMQAAPAGSTSGDLIGLCTSPGLIEAEVVVMRDPSEFTTMRRGAILVAPATDPSWTPLFTLASGVIVEVGGMLSHASTIAREYGLPALANVKHATRMLKTGDRVRLDASGGRVIQLP